MAGSTQTGRARCARRRRAAYLVAACLLACAANLAAAARQPPPPPPPPQHHHHKKMQPGDTKGMRFWERATFDPWAVAHSGTVPPEYLGVSKAEEHWIAPEEWFAERNLTERIIHVFPLIDMNSNGFVELKELERWHHINKVFVEKARAKESLEYHDTNQDGLVSLQEWLADTYHGSESLDEHETQHGGWDHGADEEAFDEDEWLRDPDDDGADPSGHHDEGDEPHYEHGDDILHEDHEDDHAHEPHHEHDEFVHANHEDEFHHDEAVHLDDEEGEHHARRRLMGVSGDEGDLGGADAGRRRLMAAQDEDPRAASARRHPAEMSAEELKGWSDKIEKLKQRLKTPEDHEYDELYWDEAGEHAGADQDAGVHKAAAGAATIAERLREKFSHALETEHGGQEHHARDGAADEAWLEGHHAADEYEDDTDYYADARHAHLHDMYSPVKTYGLASLEGDERLYHFEELFRAADVTDDLRLDVVELRHLLNPHLSKNARLQMAALNMTIAGELPYPARSHADVEAGLVPREEWMSELHWLVTEWLPGNPPRGSPGEDDFLQERAAKEFKRLDADKERAQDNKLSLTELAPMFPILFPDDTRYSHVSAVDQMKHADTNRDGRLSLDEMTAAVKVFYGAVHPDPHHLNPDNDGAGLYEHDEF